MSRELTVGADLDLSGKIVYFDATDIGLWPEHRADDALALKISRWVSKGSLCEHQVGGHRDCQQLAAGGVAYGIKLEIDISKLGYEDAPVLPVRDDDCVLVCPEHMIGVMRAVDFDLERMNTENSGSALPESILIIPVLGDIPDRQIDLGGQFLVTE